MLPKLKLIYRFDAIHTKIQASFFFFYFCSNEQVDHMETQGTQIREKKNLAKEEQRWLEDSQFQFQAHYKAMVNYQDGVVLT